MSAPAVAPAANACTIGAQPSAWTVTIRGRRLSIQPICSISSKAFHIPISPVPPPVGYKITMGYELAEQFDWDLPDVILYPTGGGTGLIGMWKAFDEMEQMGWIGSKRQCMITVQAAG